MFVLGLQGSPRLKGNTNFLLSTFMEEAKRSGATTHTIHVDKKNIVPCKEYIVCEKKGFCPIDVEGGNAAPSGGRLVLACGQLPESFLVLGLLTECSQNRAVT